MYIEIKYPLIAALSFCLLTTPGIAQSGWPGDHNPAPGLSINQKDVVLIPDLANADRDESAGRVTIPFLLKNNGNEEVQLLFREHQIDDLMDQTGQIKLWKSSMGGGLLVLK
jgi:hypothetical protein